MCHHNSNILNYIQNYKIEFLSMLLSTHSIWLMPKIPSRWENSVICSFKCELKNSQSYFSLPLKVKMKLALPWFWWLITGLSLWRPRVKSHGSPSGICEKQSDTRTGFSPGTSVCNCQCHSTTVSYSYVIHLPMRYEQLKALLNKTVPSFCENEMYAKYLTKWVIHCSLCWVPNEHQKSYLSRADIVSHVFDNTHTEIYQGNFSFKVQSFKNNWTHEFYYQTWVKYLYEYSWGFSYANWWIH